MARFVREGTIFLRQFDVIMCPLYNKGFSEVIYLYSYDRPCQLANVLTKMFNGGFYSIDWDEAFILQGVFFLHYRISVESTHYKDRQAPQAYRKTLLKISK